MAADRPAEFRPSRGHWSLTLASVALFLGLGAVSFRVATPGWVRAAFVAFGLMSVLAVLELATCRVTLTDGGLEVFSNFRRRFLPRADLESVTWEKGSGVSVRHVDGSWTRLPEVGGGSQGLANSIRAWLQRTPASLP